MGKITGISWTDHTWNPWHGCLKVSPGCKGCYMYREKKQYGQNPMVVQRSKTKFEEPLKWDAGRVFTCSWSDFFIEQADAWRDEAWDIIRRTPHLTYQILTKRPERIAGHLPADWGDGWEHVWLGVSAENQQYADERIPELLQIPARVRFLSAEPLLAAVDIGVYLSDLEEESEPKFGQIFDGISWVIVGGESGPGARRFDVEWGLSLLQQCRDSGVAFFMKQLGARPCDGGIPTKVTKAGADPAEWPAYLRVQEFPSGKGQSSGGEHQP